ncbi:MAG: hypothetical protein QOG44_1578, partial [Acidimicrobiaceae bacterium]|nr:hypothetical protein [Acidimicrobiaceae bacterium]
MGQLTDRVATAVDHFGGLDPGHLNAGVGSGCGIVGFVGSLGAALAGDAIAVHALCPSYADTALLAPIRSLVDGGAFPILDVEDVADAFFQILDSDATGECWFVV